MNTPSFYLVYNRRILKLFMKQWQPRIARSSYQGPMSVTWNSLGFKKRIQVYYFVGKVPRLGGEFIDNSNLPVRATKELCLLPGYLELSTRGTLYLVDERVESVNSLTIIITPALATEELCLLTGVS